MFVKSAITVRKEIRTFQKLENIQVTYRDLKNHTESIRLQVVGIGFVQLVMMDMERFHSGA